MQEKYADFSVLFVDERPVDGSDYAMVVISPTSPFPPGATLGVAAQDCDDMNTTPVVFNFFEAGDVFELELKINAIAYQFARSTGLDVVDTDVGDIMYQFALPNPASFLDECLHLREARPPNCPAQHTGVCPVGGEQNSYAELLDRFGPL